MLRKFTLLLIVPLFLFACKKDTEDSIAEKNQSYVQRLIKDYSVAMVECYVGANVFPSSSSPNCSFSNGYIYFKTSTTTEAGYNLASLDHYEVGYLTGSGTPVKALRLYFK
jgi:hypothetical protein